MKFRTKMVICMIWLLALAYGIGGSLLIASSFHDSMEQKASARQSCQMLLNTLSILEDQSSVASTLQQLDSSGSAEWSGLLVRSGNAVLFRSGSSPLLDTVAADPNTLTVRDRQILITCLLSGGITELEVRMVSDISDAYTRRDSQLSIYRWTFLAVTVLGAALSWLLCTWYLYSPRRPPKMTFGTVLASSLYCSYSAPLAASLIG